MNDKIMEYILGDELLYANQYCKLSHGELIYHYTSASGLLGILKRDCCKLWFTKYNSLNDSYESKNISDFLKSYCSKRIETGIFSREFATRIMSLTPSNKRFITIRSKTDNSIFLERGITSITNMKQVPCDTYLCCFSDDADSLPMWNYYSKSDRYEGYNIGFLCGEIGESHFLMKDI